MELVTHVLNRSRFLNLYTLTAMFLVRDRYV